jgi:multiple antibiotic resistance protein
MIHLRQFERGLAGRQFPMARIRPAIAITLIACLLVGIDGASAADDIARQVQAGQLPLAQIFTILFLMLGPFKLVGPFLKVTQGADIRLARRVALWATVFSALALMFAGLLGETMLESYGVPLDILRLAGGIILFLVALETVLEQFAPAETPHDVVALSSDAVMRVAMRPLAFPGIVTPYGIAALVVFLAFSQSTETRLAIGAVVVGIMALNLIFMLAARRLQVVFALVLPILGAVLGVVQVALGLHFINNALHALNIL